MPTKNCSSLVLGTGGFRENIQAPNPKPTITTCSSPPSSLWPIVLWQKQKPQLSRQHSSESWAASERLCLVRPFSLQPRHEYWQGPVRSFSSWACVDRKSTRLNSSH